MNILCALILLTFVSYSFTFPTKASSPEAISSDHRGFKDNVEERGVEFQGDILGIDIHSNQINSGLINEAKRWPNNTVVFHISNQFSSSQKEIIRNATRLITDKTCIQMQELLTEQPGKDYVTVVKVPSGCSSHVGRIGGTQKLNLATGCLSKGTIAHEFIHAIGFYHEQSRSDRDDFVSILYENIEADREYNFEKYAPTFVDPFNVTYDYGSIMHYSEYAFSKDGKKTIQPKIAYKGKIGQRDALSASDAQKINNMYCGSKKYGSW